MFGNDGIEDSAAISYVRLCGTVIEATALAEGYDNPVGRTLYYELYGILQEELERLSLRVGGEHVVFGYKNCSQYVNYSLPKCASKYLQKHFEQKKCLSFFIATSNESFGK